MINKTDALVHKLLTDAIKGKVILFTTPSITNSFYDQCKSPQITHKQSVNDLVSMKLARYYRIMKYTPTRHVFDYYCYIHRSYEQQFPENVLILDKNIKLYHEGPTRCT